MTREGGIGHARSARPAFPSHPWRVRRRDGGAAFTPPIGLGSVSNAAGSYRLPLPRVPHSSAKTIAPTAVPLATTYMLVCFVCVSGCCFWGLGSAPSAVLALRALSRGARRRRRAVLAQAAEYKNTTSLTSGGSGAEPHSSYDLDPPVNAGAERGTGGVAAE